MNLSKSLLGAVLAGITLQTAPSCNVPKGPAVKEEKKAVEKDTVTERKDTSKPQTAGDGCPACGMG
ncbi:chryseobasin-related MNIO class RiPP peptide [Chitinophaga sp. 22536]|uniref:chryseobasin-related MNIO class RiPP peptide n=1 Tax=unclassified Chitinophaga TaxID=2619133 RepID=UPI003F835AB0